MKKILGIGNALVDILVKLSSEEIVKELQYPKGSMQLISAAELNKVANTTLGLDKHVAAGGSASNTLVGLARLGVEVGFVGKIGADETGESYKKCLMDNGVEPHLLVSEFPSGRCHVLISPDSERTMCTYLGAASQLSAQDISTEVFKGYDIVHVEGYLVQNYELMECIGRMVKECGAKLSIDLASFNVVEENMEFLSSFVERYVDVLFANQEEAKVFTSLEDEDALMALVECVEVAIVKVGSKGSYAIRAGEEKVFMPANKVVCIDTTGAGDLYASGFLYGLANDLSLVKCAEIATCCAGTVVQVLGAKIPESGWKLIMDKV